MPANPLSFHVTDAYREQLEQLHATAEAVALAAWRRLDPADLDGTYPIQAVTANLAALQLQTARASRSYLTAFLTSELGSPTEASPAGSSASIGRSRDGRLLGEAFYSPLIAVKATLKAGGGSERALRDGFNRLKLMAGLELNHVADLTLLTAIDQDERFDGWQRAVRGTCGMCLGAASGPDGGLRFPRHPNCFPAGTLVSGPSATAASARWYEGDLVELRFHGGGFLPCTPNHPILTPRGFVPAGQLSEGGDVVRSVGEQRGVARVSPDDHKRPALIEDVAESLRCAGKASSVTMPTASEHFHGDGAGGNVEVVWADRFLQGAGKPTIGQQPSQVPLCLGCVGLVSLIGLSALDLLGQGNLAATNSGMGGFGVALAFLGGQARGAEYLGFPNATPFDSGFSESAADDDAVHAEAFADRKFGLAPLISGNKGRDVEVDASDDLTPLDLDPPFTEQSAGSVGIDPDLARRLLNGAARSVDTDKIIDFRRVDFRGYVYNLQTDGGWYSANSTIVHNCKCVSEPRVSGARERYPRPTGAEIFDAMDDAEQDAALGPKAAEAVRNGLPLSSLIESSPQKVGDDFAYQGAVPKDTGG